jgi:hypothetical protein
MQCSPRMFFIPISCCASNFRKSPPFHSRSRLAAWLLAVILIVNPSRASFRRGQFCAGDLTHLRDRSTMAGRRAPEIRTFRMMEPMEVVDGPTRFQVAALQFKSVLYSQYSSSLSTGSSIPSFEQLPRSDVQYSTWRRHASVAAAGRRRPAAAGLYCKNSRKQPGTSVPWECQPDHQCSGGHWQSSDI